MTEYIPWAKPQFWGKETDYVQEALGSMWLSGGAFIQKLEILFSTLYGNKYCLAVSNGTAAIHCAYLAIPLQEGDEIIVPGFGFLAAANVALHMKMRPVFAEVQPDTWCIDAHDVESKITPKTRAIVALHTYGNLCDMEPLLHSVAARNIVLIEDCAEALFSRYRNQYCGTIGHIGTYSFQATKTVTTGEGGLIVTGNGDWYEQMKLYQSHGLKTRGTYRHHLPGHNFRLTNIQAAMGVAQVECKEAIINERRRVYHQYLSLLGDEDGVQMQEITEGAEPVWWTCAVRLDSHAFPQGRDAVMNSLAEYGIETRPGFLASSRHTFYPNHRVPICEELSDTIMSLPFYASLAQEQVDYICTCLRRLKK
jgi:perosamine synthetase